MDDPNAQGKKADARDHPRQHAGEQGQNDAKQNASNPHNSQNQRINRIKAIWTTIKKDWKEASFHDNVNICLTLVIALSTVSYTIVASRTLSEIHSGSKDTHELAEAARDQWRELNATRQYAHESLTLRDRPLIGFLDNAVTVKEISPMREWKVSYRTRNFGDSPARRVIPRSIARWGEIEKWSGFLCEDMEQDMHDGTKPATVLFPKTEMQFSETVRSAIPATDKQKHWLIVRIGYHDAWGPPNKFCAVLFYSLDDSKVVGAEAN